MRRIPSRLTCARCQPVAGNVMSHVRHCRIRHPSSVPTCARTTISVGCASASTDVVSVALRSPRIVSFFPCFPPAFPLLSLLLRFRGCLHPSSSRQRRIACIYIYNIYASLSSICLLLSCTSRSMSRTAKFLSLSRSLARLRSFSFALAHTVSPLCMSRVSVYVTCGSNHSLSLSLSISFTTSQPCVSATSCSRVVSPVSARIARALPSSSLSRKRRPRFSRAPQTWLAPSHPSAPDRPWSCFVESPPLTRSAPPSVPTYPSPSLRPLLSRQPSTLAPHPGRLVRYTFVLSLSGSVSRTIHSAHSLSVLRRARIPREPFPRRSSAR